MGLGSTMRRGLRTLQAGGVLRRVVRELAGIRGALERANELKELELRALVPEMFAEEEAPDTSAPPLMVTEVDDQLAYDLSVIELTLTRTLGMPPTEDQVLAEYERLHADPDDPRRLSLLEQAYYHQPGRHQ